MNMTHRTTQATTEDRIRYSMKMTHRAKAYLMTRATMFALLGVALLVTGYGPLAASYMWAYPMFLCSSALVASAMWGTEGRARAALLATVCLGSLWFGGFVAEAILFTTFSPISLIAWGGIVVIDLIMIRRPLTTPFEELLTTTD